MRMLLNPTTDFINERLEDLFSEIQLPIDFSIAFEVRENGKKILLDVDLPEIEDYPQKKSKLLASGKVSIKDKTQKELKQDYMTSVTAISFYFASIAFTAAPGIDTVLVSGYTQRIDKSTGKEVDEYIYSVKFNIDNFFEINVDKIDPPIALQKFEHIIDITKTYELKKIEPMG